jgi:uncharacterized protein YkwD
MEPRSGQRPILSDPAVPSNSPRLVPLDKTFAQALPLARYEVSIGSAADNDFVLASETISRHHAILAGNGTEYRVTDLGSTNGTYVNGRRVTGSATVKSGDEIRFGGARYVLRDGVTRGAAPLARRQRRVSSVMLGVIGLAFIFSFGVAEFLLNFNRLDQAADGTPASADSSDATSSATDSSPEAVLHKAAAAAVSSNAPAASAVALEEPPAPDVARWLDPLNRYRAMAGLNPVTADAKLSRGDYLHSRYLVKNYADDIRKGTSGGAQMHTETAGNPWYTADGLAAAGSSDVDEMSNPHATPPPSWAIDNWMEGPFHRLWILNPNLHSVGYGTYCEAGVCVASLNVLTDSDPIHTKPKPLDKPIQYPPHDSTTHGLSVPGEWPDPLSSCPGYDDHAGMPITLQLGAMVTPAVSSYALTRDGAAIEACGFDASTYSNPDAFAQNRARDGLRNFGAIVLIPRATLAPGNYSVAITTADRTYSWSFTITP